MFVPGDKVEIMHCPTMPHLNGVEGILIATGKSKGKLNSTTEGGVFRPTPWENTWAFWQVQPNNGYGQQIEAYVCHIVEVGDKVRIDNAPIGWKEIQGKILPICSIDKDKHYYAVQSPRGLSVRVEDFRPVHMIQPVVVEEKVDSDLMTKATVLDAVFSMCGTDLGSIDESVLELLGKLEIDFNDHDVVAKTYISVSLHENIKYGKGIAIDDKVAIASQLASKFKDMSLSDLTSYLLKNIEGVDALS